MTLGVRFVTQYDSYFQTKNYRTIDRCRGGVEFPRSIFGLGTFGQQFAANFAEANVIGVGIVEFELLDQVGEV